jgi:glycerol-3-phosphate dehydrogenase
MFSKLYGKAHHADPNRPQYKIRARHDMLTDIKDENNEFDIIVVGGGSTGTGAALDAATRGLKVLCVEREDFSSGTSSRSTKLIWGW